MLTGFWAIDEKPTGSKDPYALRRAALGIIRIILENSLRISLKPILQMKIAYWPFLKYLKRVNAKMDAIESLADMLVYESAHLEELSRQVAVQSAKDSAPSWRSAMDSGRVGADDLLAFFADRLKVYLREKGARHDLIDAVFALPGQDDLLMIVRRVEALGKLLDTEDGKNLLAGYRRAANILRAEEKKDGAEAFVGKHVQTTLAPPAERYLADVVASAGAAVRQLVASEDFEGAMRALATLRAPVDGFFLDVTVNDPDPETRLNRLRLLNELREAMHAVADFSKVSG